MQALTSPADHDSIYQALQSEDDTPTSPQEYTPLLPRYNRTRSRTWQPVFVCFMLMIFLLGLTIGIYLLVEQDKEWPVNIAFDMISRTGWSAKSPQRTLQLLSVQPATHIVISHTNTESCKNFVECQKILLDMQDMYQRNNMSDLPFNFLFGNDGETYEGRGWDYAGDIDLVVNNKSICLGVIGDFVKSYPTQNQLKEVKAFIDESIRRRKLLPTYNLIGRPFNGTPTNLFDIVSTWTHWHDD